MKKKTRNLMILLAVLVVLVGAYFLITALTRQEEELEQQAQTLFSCEQSDISKITYEYEEEKISLVYSGENWIYEKDETFPLDQSYVETMLSALSNVEVLRSFQAEDDLASYGLSSPEAKVTALLDNGEEVTFSVGSYNDVTSSYYLMKEGDNNVYMTSSPIANAFTYGLMDLAQSGSIPENFSDAEVYEIGYTSKDKKIKLSSPVTMETYYEDFLWQAQLGEDTMIASTQAVNQIISEVQSLDLSKLKAYNVDEKELLKLGFDDEIVLEFKYQYEVNDGSDEEETEEEPVYEEAALKIHFAKADEENYYAMLDGDTKVYTISSTGIEDIISLDSDYLEISEVFLLDFDTVEAMDVTYNDQTYKVELSRETYTNESGYEEVDVSAKVDGKSVGGAYIEGFFEDILSMIKEADATDDTKGQDVMKIVFYRNTQGEYQQMTLTFSEYDSSFMRASFAGRDDMLVNKRDVENLITDFDEILSLIK